MVPYWVFPKELIPVCRISVTFVPQVQCLGCKGEVVIWSETTGVPIVVSLFFFVEIIEFVREFALGIIKRIASRVSSIRTPVVRPPNL